MTVQEIDSSLIFVSDSQDVQDVKESVRTSDSAEFDAFFVGVKDGDYTEVWGMYGIVPYNYKNVYRVL
jgi:hypothetical protein